MSQEKGPPFGGRIHVGDSVWYRVNYKEVWRLGQVIELKNENHYYGYGCRVKTKGLAEHFINGNSYDEDPLPGNFAQLPNGTTYLIAVEGIRRISQHLPKGCEFDVFECNTKYQSAGKLLGYLITPSSLYDVRRYYKLPSFKTWTLAPNVYELFSFLGQKLPEIAPLAILLKAERAKLEPKHEESND